jgi:hypothetical protein
MIALMRNCWKFTAIQLSSARSSRPKNIANADEITQQIAALKSRLAALDRSEIAERLSALEHVCAADAAAQRFPVFARVTMSSPTADKMALFRSLFRGRDDVFPHRSENPKSGKAGYSPVCRNEWVRGVCGKPQVKCRECARPAHAIVRYPHLGKTGRAALSGCGLSFKAESGPWGTPDPNADRRSAAF